MRIVESRRAWAARIVLRASATSSLAIGARPLSMTGLIAPGTTDTISTVVEPIDAKPDALPEPTAATPSMALTAAITPAVPPFAFERLTVVSQLQPYSRGVLSRWARLAETTRDMTTATTPSVAAPRADRTGTAS